MLRAGGDAGAHPAKAASGIPPAVVVVVVVHLLLLLVLLLDEERRPTDAARRGQGPACGCRGGAAARAAQGPQERARRRDALR